MLKAVSAATLAEQDAERQRMAAELNAAPMASPLISYLRTLLDNAIRARRDSGVDAMLKAAQLALNSEYSAEQKARIAAQVSSDVFVHLTETKFNAACAWISDMRESVGDNRWNISPTPTPNMAEKVREFAMQRARQDAYEDFLDGQPWPGTDELEAHAAKLEEDIAAEVERQLVEAGKEAASAMRTEIADQLVDCDFEDVMDLFEAFCVGFGTGFLKGPVIRWKHDLDWGDDPRNVVVSKRAIPTVESPNPMDIFPVAGSSRKKAGIFERIGEMTREDLMELRGLPYYQDKAIDELLANCTKGYVEQFVDTDNTRSKQELKLDRFENAGGTYEVWEYWGPVSAEKLVEWGIASADQSRVNSVQVIFCSRWPIKVMPNPDPVGDTPYFKAVFKARPGSFWGKPMYHVMRDAQDIGNSTWRAICDNEGMGSGPMVAIDTYAVHPDDVKIPHPRMVIRYDGDKLSANGSSRKPVEFFQPETKAHELMALATKAETMADNETGIPAYSYGSDTAAGAGKTASGYSMLLNAASRGLKHTLKSMDSAMEGLIRNFYRWNMIYNDKPEIKGDVQVVAKGTLRVMVEELHQARLQEFMQFVESSPMAQKLAELEGFNKLIRQYAEAVHIDPDGIFPSEEELKARMEQEKAQLMAQLVAMQQGGMPAQPGAMQ